MRKIFNSCNDLLFPIIWNFLMLNTEINISGFLWGGGHEMLTGIDVFLLEYLDLKILG
jgi:hypothetical protein